MTTWVRPVNGPITQLFGQLPGMPWGDCGPGGHPGVDYGCPSGTPIVAAAAGQVIHAGPAEGFGDHAVSLFHIVDSVATTYGHMEAHYVQVGQMVHVGQLLGLADTQGEATGPHLHFELRPGNAPFGAYPPNVDPDAWLHAHGAYGTSPLQPAGQLTAADREAVRRIQAAAGVAVDGAWGKRTDDALQTLRWHHLTPPNAYNVSGQVRQLQAAFRFAGKDCDGVWGPNTDHAYLLARYCYLNK